MANTIIVPEIFAPIVRQKMLERIKISALAYHSDLLNGTQQGETVYFPQWVKGSAAIEIQKKDRIPTEELNQDKSFATIKQIAAGKEIYDRDALTALGTGKEWKQEAALQIAESFAEKIDSDLAEEAQSTSLRFSTQNAMGIAYNELGDAMTLFGDSQDFDSFAGIVVHPIVASAIYSWGTETSFTNKNDTSVTDGNGIVRNNLIGYWRAIPIFLSSAGTFDKAKNETITYCIKKNALGLLTKRDIWIEESRDSGGKKTDLYADMLYAVKLLDPNGVAILRKTIA